MGRFTVSLREILEKHRNQGQHLTNVEDVYDISSFCLFDEIPTGVISDQYLQQFITGFTLHFFNEEIGLESLSLWKIALNEKLYNYGSYINKIYANIDKEIFADYRVKNVSNEGSTSNESTKTGSLSNEKEDTTSTTTGEDLTHVQTVAGGGTITNAKSGSDTLLRDLSEENDRTVDESVVRTGTDANAHTGTQSTQGSNEQDTENTGTTANDKNTVQINYDTPMGSLQNLRTPGGNAKGTGVDYANGQTYQYMSSAIEVNDSNVQTDDTAQHTEGTDNSTTTFNDTNTETRNLTDTTDLSSNDSRTLDLSDVQSYNSSNTETRNTLDTTNATDSKDITTSSEASSTDTQTSENTSSETGTHEDTTDEIDYSMNWEMLYRSMPLLNKVWEVFDDLFMIIY